VDELAREELVANVLLLYGAASAVVGHGLAAALPPWLGHTCLATLGIAVVQTSARAQSAASIYGWRFAALVPVRVLWGNLVNFAATATALREFFDSRWSGTSLAWRKTEHVYPTSTPALATGAAAYRKLALNQRLAGSSSGVSEGVSA